MGICLKMIVGKGVFSACTMSAPEPKAQVQAAASTLESALNAADKLIAATARNSVPHS